ncbi:hypothetical protein NKG05_09645 [Oerskovia sp. M15]
MPNGFNFWTPMTDAASQSWLYAYQQQNNANNKPQLQGIGVSHEPSPWMGDRNQLAFLPAAGGATPNATLGTRALEFTHDDETAQPDYYGVTFTNGIQAEVTPTDHGAVLRFSYATDQGQVLVDSVSGDAKLAYDAASGTLSGWVDGGSGLSAAARACSSPGRSTACPARSGPPRATAPTPGSRRSTPRRTRPSSSAWPRPSSARTRRARTSTSRSRAGPSRTCAPRRSPPGTTA